MAGFTAELNDPGRIPEASGSASVSLEGVAGNLLGGIAKIGDMALTRWQQDDARDAANDVSKKLTDLVQTNWGQNPDGTRMVGEPPADPAKAAAATNPVVQGALSQLDRLHQANAQGALSPTELFTRGSVIVQDAINAHPLFATEIRQAAQAVLGTQPTQEIIRLTEADVNATQAAQREVQHSLVLSAANAGVTFMGADGSLDFDKMAQAGAEINFQNRQLELTIKQAQLAASAAGPAPTDKDKLNAELTPFLKGSNAVFEKVQDGLLSGVPALVQKLSNAGDEVKLAQVNQAIGVQEASFNAWVDQQIVKNNVSPEAADAIHKYYKGIFDNYRQLATGDLSHWATNAKALQAMANNSGITFRQTAPALATIYTIGGQPAVQAAINTALATDSKYHAQFDQEVGNLIGRAFAPANPVDAMHNTGSALSGAGYNVGAEQNPDMQKKVLTGLIGTINGYTQNPDTLGPKELKAFGNAAGQISGVALQSNDPRELQAAANTINSPAIMRTFDRYAKDPGSAANVPAVAEGMIAVNVKNLQRGLPRLAQGNDTTLAIPPGPPPGSGFLDQLSYAAAAASGQSGAGIASVGGSPVISVHTTASFNPVTGRVEMVSTATGPDGKAYRLNPQQAQQVLRDNQDFRNSVDSMNRSLDATVSLAPHGMGREKDLKALELKQLLVAGSGFPNKEGTRPIPMPDWLTKPAQNTPNKPSASAAAPANPNPPATGDVRGGPSPNYADYVKKHESGGDYSIRNGTGSSAGGAYQFLPDTFRSIVRGLPDGKNLSDAEIERLRTSATPAGRSLQDRAFEAYTMKNTADLNAHGIYHVDDTALELAHWFGGAGARKFLYAPMDAKIEDLFGKKVVQQNPNLRGKTVKEVYNDLAKQFGGKAIN